MASSAASPGINVTSCSTERSALAQALTQASIGLVLALGLPLNAAALWVLGRRLRRWTETRVYMVNLAAADCLLVLSLPGVLSTLGQPRGVEEGTACRVLQGFYHANTYLSVGLLTAVAADRYAALRLPLRARGWRSPRQAALTCAGLWLLVLAAVGLSAAGLRPGERLCFGRGHTRGPRTLAFSLLLFFLLLPVMGFCSAQVLWHLARERRRAPPQFAGLTLKALHVVAANLVTFLVCFLPLHVALLATLVAQWTGAACPTVQRVAAFVQVASRLANANCCLDAAGYYFVAKEFQEEVGALLVSPQGASASEPPGPGGQGGAAEEARGPRALAPAPQGPPGRRPPPCPGVAGAVTDTAGPREGTLVRRTE
ncbi:G-protein coupled receptor 35-like [Talpa occidentalis]|uniref:G-protein coupled receptor 35-like n=1 Tax=Talpa occidentalis TaxID=50954 RepID=UPI00188EBFEC|nr:G-protein coupled receptor 35-like [Talpa occidentalis]